jgi:hypothetical protein
MFWPVSRRPSLRRYDGGRRRGSVSKASFFWLSRATPSQ